MLVQAICRRDKEISGGQIITDERFLQIQRIATYGARTIEAVLTDPVILTGPATQNADDAITLAYRWFTAIAEFTGTATTIR